MDPKNVIYTSDVVEDGIKIGWRVVDVKVGQGRVAACVIEAVDCMRARQRGFRKSPIDDALKPTTVCCIGAERRVTPKNAEYTHG